MGKVSEAFLLIAELGSASGVTKINRLPGLWSHRVDEKWAVKVNGHNQEIEGVPPFCAAIEYNGWPAGMIQPSGGIIVNSVGASEDAFCDALQAAIRRARTAQPKPAGEGA